MSENLCANRYQCPALCCINTTLEMSINDFNRCFYGKAREIEPDQDIFAIARSLKGLGTGVVGMQGAVYERNENTVTVQLTGACPNLDLADFSCQVYNKRPEPCKRFEFEGTDCQRSRRNYNRP